MRRRQAACLGAWMPSCCGKYKSSCSRFRGLQSRATRCQASHFTRASRRWRTSLSLLPSSTSRDSSPDLAPNADVTSTLRNCPVALSSLSSTGRCRTVEAQPLVAPRTSWAPWYGWLWLLSHALGFVLRPPPRGLPKPKPALGPYPPHAHGPLWQNGPSSCWDAKQGAGSCRAGASSKRKHQSATPQSSNAVDRQAANTKNKSGDRFPPCSS